MKVYVFKSLPPFLWGYTRDIRAASEDRRPAWQTVASSSMATFRIRRRKILSMPCRVFWWDILFPWRTVRRSIKTWARHQNLSPSSHQLREMLTLLPPEKTESLLKQGRISIPIRILQALMICAWHGTKA